MAPTIPHGRACLALPVWRCPSRIQQQGRGGADSSAGVRQKVERVGGSSRNDCLAQLVKCADGNDSCDQRAGIGSIPRQAVRIGHREREQRQNQVGASDCPSDHKTEISKVPIATAGSIAARTSAAGPSWLSHGRGWVSWKAGKARIDGANDFLRWRKWLHAAIH